jgi:hypothetical protein
MKRAAYIFAALAVLLFADGIYLDVSNNAAGCSCSGDTGTLFGGSTNINLSEGTEVLIGAGFLLIVAIIIWIVATMRARAPVTSGISQAGQAKAAMASAGESQAKTEVTAGPGQPRKESGDQH